MMISEITLSRAANPRAGQRVRRYAVLALSVGIAVSFCNAAFAQSAAAEPNTAELEKLETKMFSRHYPNDPVEKRVERLELLVFGATQGGSLDERWANISKVIKHRQNPEATVPQSSGASAGAPKSADSAPQKGNYPAVDSLEWRVLKKTYRTEPIAERLSRLETKLLGQANPNMALFDRVERLKKIGATVAGGNSPRSSPLVPPGMLGPMPKGYPREMPFAFGDQFPDSAGPMSPFSMQPFSGSGDDSMNFGSLNRMMSEMMTQMNKQMRDLKNLPPGTYQYRLEPGDPTAGVTPFKLIPSQPGVQPGTQPRKPGQASPFNQNSPFQLMPRTAPSIPENLPPYADPNSI
jgi:hypothetical protein